MTQAEKLLLLLKVGLKNTEPTNDDCKDIMSCSLNEWNDIKNLASVQGVSAIAFDGLKILYETFGNNIKAIKDNNTKWKMMLLEWTAISAQTEIANKKQRKVIAEVSEIWNDNGINMLVFKGQACASYYPEPLHRTAGDIDCYLFGREDEGNLIMEKKGISVNRNWYRHSSMLYGGETIENHKFIAYTRNGKSSKMLNYEMTNALQDENREKIEKCGKAEKPTLTFDAILLPYHALQHFLFGGFCLKQIIDWAMFLKHAQNKIEWNKLYCIYEEYNLRRFSDAITTIATKNLGVYLNNPSIICESKYADQILDCALNMNLETIKHYNSRWLERWQKAKDMLTKNRWKYRDICQQSAIKTLTKAVIGLFFKTEED